MAIGYTNSDILILARGRSREQELDIRRATGGTRWRIVRQLLVEAVVISFRGAVFGLAASYLARQAAPVDLSGSLSCRTCHQHKGVGTALLSAIESAAPVLGVVRLLAEASLTGTTFYERHGYSRTGRTLDGVAGVQIEVEKVVD